ncbi:MAG: THUMP domain-containing protein [Crenarchaeota archaeon]|nr:THUMP domain-containing protein [Thermoproteota archaeon]MCR8454474.1 THUMP domain-containing protein [Thermoproteota archaeon]MCR8463561.1 THUMP domain-containing protein [Thermoproteota archaeon]MCR8473724.1 THUMP domain-containing protein [Thermoproteota archaeon]
MSHIIVPFNTRFLVTCQQRYELDAASEVWHCLYVSGYGEDIEVHFIRKYDRAIAGLIAIVFNGDPIEAIEKMRNYLLKKPWILRYTHKIIPVEFVTNSIDALLTFIHDKARLRIKEDDHWRISISKRASKISSKKLIEQIAHTISWGKVSLQNPQWIVNVEVVRDVFLASLIKPEWIIHKKTLMNTILRVKPLEYVDRPP